MNPPSDFDRDRDWTVSTGEILREWREDHGHGVAHAAMACFMTIERYEAIEAGEQPIDALTAIRLAGGTGISAAFWLAYDRVYRDELAAGKRPQSGPPP